MGICTSFISSATQNGQTELIAKWPPSPTMIKIIFLDGSLQEFSPTTKVAPILNLACLLHCRDCFLCSAEYMHLGEPPQQFLPVDRELRPGDIYFVLPLSQSQCPLSLQDLCLLAVKASTALGRCTVGPSAVAIGERRGVFPLALLLKSVISMLKRKEISGQRTPLH